MNQWTIIGLVLVILLVVIGITTVAQVLVENRIAASADPVSSDVDTQKKVLELSKIDAEISKLRSDTLGSLFWLKLIALLVTVGGAVGGYLVGVEKSTKARVEFEERISKKRIEFEQRKNVDSVYQSIVKELSDNSAILRAAAATKLGAILQDFPAEWDVEDERKKQLVRLTKQVIAAALAIETDAKVLKTLTIQLIGHKIEKEEKPKHSKAIYDARDLDLSGVKAVDAYWADTDFSRSDFYKADLNRASFRRSTLEYSQFRESDLRDSVFADASCPDANFKMADLRGADFSHADLSGASLAGCKVYGAIFEGANLDKLKESDVDTSKRGDGHKFEKFTQFHKA